MTKRDIDCVQEYLTIVGAAGERVYQIVNVELLLNPTTAPPAGLI
jgi:hypothetical protein